MTSYEDERDLSEEAHNRMTLITGDGTYERGGPCPDCGSTATTLYPMGEGAMTLYCDTCKREEPAATRGNG